MDFDTLLNYCIKLNESHNEKCLVCHIPFKTNDSYLKLKCNHLFHKNCIGYKKGATKCLYCDKSSIPESINVESPDVNIPTSKYEIACKVILKSGINKGQYCNRSDCKYHALNKKNVIIINSLSKQTNNKTQIVKCLFILKSGKNCGKICGRYTPCKYHKINNTIQTVNTNDDNLIEV